MPMILSGITDSLYMLSVTCFFFFFLTTVSSLREATMHKIAHHLLHYDR